MNLEVWEMLWNYLGIIEELTKKSIYYKIEFIQLKRTFHGTFRG